jgi:hypothetical protein
MRNALSPLPSGSDRTLITQCALLIFAIVVFWIAYILMADVRCIYAVQEVVTFRNSRFLDIFGVMEFGNFKRLSPLGFGIWGYLDIHLLVPLLGRENETSTGLAAANRLLPFHVLFLAILCGCAAFVSWKLFRSYAITLLAILLFGLNDAIPFQFRFASTLLCYQLQIATILAIYFLAGNERSSASFLGAAACIVFNLLVWEQGLNLAVATSVFLVILIVQSYRSRTNRRWEVLLLLTIVVATAIYLVVRIRGGTDESLANDNEASFFFSYANPLLWFDDFMLNFSALVTQSVRQLFPFPLESFSVILGKDMNQLNPYNVSYAQYPNMPYRFMGLWFSGFCFCLSWVLIATTAHLARKTNQYLLPLLAVCVFVFGFSMHLPVMHRDYFYIPGYTLGYKASVSYVGFVFMLSFIAARIQWDGLSLLVRARFFAILYCYLIAAAVVRAAALTAPQRFPW